MLWQCIMVVSRLIRMFRFHAAERELDTTLQGTEHIYTRFEII